MRRLFSILAATALVAATASTGSVFVSLSAQGGKVPQYELDSSWPPALPNNWAWGVPTWIAVDKHDNVWVLHRPRTAMSSSPAPAARATRNTSRSRAAARTSARARGAREQRREEPGRERRREVAAGRGADWCTALAKHHNA